MIDYHIRITARCDVCGRTIDDAVVVKPVDINPARWKWEREWRKRGVMQRVRRYGQPRLYCQPCADGVPKRS